MLSDTERLLATVEQVLKAGEVGQRARNQVRLQLQFERLGLRDCIRTTLQRYHLKESTIHFSVEPDAEQLAVVGNPEDLRTAVLNILDNAVSNYDQGPQLEVHLSLDGEAWLMLAVSDQGLGIASPHLKRIFKRFYRVPARNVFRIKGTGLGLFLVRTIARQHGGDVVAESEGEGRGATIRLAASPRALRRRQRGTDDEHQHSGGRRLRLTPRRACCLICARKATPHNWRWWDGETALEMIAAEPIDAVILDVMLPGAGRVLAVAVESRSAKEISFHSHAHRPRPSGRCARRLQRGWDDYLPKPFDLSILLARLKGLLRRIEHGFALGLAAAPAPPARAAFPCRPGVPPSPLPWAHHPL